MIPSPLFPVTAVEVEMELFKLSVPLGGTGPGWQLVVWEIMVRVRMEKNITRLDTYNRAFRPALSIKLAAKATERRRTAPTRAASYLPDTEQRLDIIYELNNQRK